MYLHLLIDIYLLFNKYALKVCYTPGTVVDVGHTVARSIDTASSHVEFSLRG